MRKETVYAAPSVIAASAKEWNHKMEILEETLLANGPFVAGHEFTLAGMMCVRHGERLLFFKLVKVGPENRTMLRTIAWVIAAIAIAGDGFSADADRGARIFRACSSCHIVDDTRSTFGPSLKGVVGHRAATMNDYVYSLALQKAGEDGLVWSERELAEFLANPSRKIPGTKMRFWGLWNFEIDDLIAFLKANP